MNRSASGRDGKNLAHMFKRVARLGRASLLAVSILLLAVAARPAAGGEIVLQNAAMHGVLGSDGVWRSLTLRASGRELIPPGVRVAFASATFDAAPAAQGAGADFDVATQQRLMAAAAGRAKSNAKSACRARREGDLLTIGFEGTACELALRVTEEPDAITFTIASVTEPRPREVEFARLGVAPLTRVGSRLGAAWDDTLAVGLAATNLQTIASARRAANHALLTATTQDSPGPRLEGAGAALVAAPPAQYRAVLARLAARCPELPVNQENGVASRELASARGSYWFHNFGEADVERVIADCQKSGLKQVMLTSSAWCSSPGHYLFNTKLYPDGQASLRRTVARLHEAGILAGMHCYGSKIAKIDPYVSPVPDTRFWADRTTVLAAAVGAGDTVIRTKSDLREWPGSPVASQKLWEGGVTKHQEVVIDGEIVQYGSIGPEGKWDSFLDCTRGAWKTAAQTHAAGADGRHYAVDGCINGYIIDQETTLLDEVAERLAGIYNDCNFDMVYFDGGEDVDRRRFNYYVSKFQAAAMRRFTKRPLIHMGTIMTHPLWNSFTRSGTVDTYPNTIGAVRLAGAMPDQIPTVREHIDKSVDYLLSVRQDMVPGELGWFGIWPRGKGLEGVQLDEIEYLMARSLAYDAPISLQTSFRQMDGHPLTPGVLEIVRVYEGLRLANAFDEATRAPLREKGVESALVRAGGAWRLARLGPVGKTAAGVRFSVGELDGGAVAILWGAEQATELTIAMPRAEVRAETIEGEAVGLGEDAAKVALRIGPRRLTLFAPRLAPGELKRRLAGDEDQPRY